MTIRPRRSALKLHLTLLAGLALCGVAGWIEWRRALGGHTLSWVYAFEWPLFAVFGTWIWWRLLHEERRSRPATSRRRSRRAAARIDEQDPGLSAWRAYLAELDEAERRDAP